MSSRQKAYPPKFWRAARAQPGALRLLLWALPLLLIATESAAQQEPVFDHPLFTGPIREAQSSPIDIGHIRVDLAVDPVEHEVTGRLTVTFRRVGTESISIAVSADSTAVTDASFFESGMDADSSLVWENGEAFLRLPAQSLDAESVFVLSVDLGPSVRFETYPLGIDSGPWLSVRTEAAFGGEQLLPFASSLDDWFTADLRVAVPDDWTVFLPGTRLSSILSGDRSVERSSIHFAGPVSQIGFAAGARLTVSDTVPQYASLDANLERARLNSTVATVASIQDFFADRTHVELDSSRTIFRRGIGNGSFRGMKLTLLPETLISSENDPVARDHVLAAGIAHAWMQTHLRPSGWTDIWVQEALSEYMALAYVRENHGEIAYMDVLWKLRREYLDEFFLYQRPLVWDRWEHPVNILDEHARGKGAWVLHMLEEQLGTESIFESIRRMAEMGLERTIGTEELRAALESNSGVNLADFFDQWIYGAGHPVLEYDYDVRPEQDEIDLEIVQKQSGHLVPSGFTFDLEVEAASLAGIDDALLRVSGPSTSVMMPVSLRPHYVRLDPNGKLLFDFDRPQDVSHIVSGLLRARTETSRYLSVAMLRDADVDPSLLLGLRAIMSGDLHPILHRDLLGVLGNLAPSSSAIREILPAISDSSGSVRAAAISSLRAFTSSTEARQVAFEAANNEQDPVVLSAAVRTLVHLNPTLAWRVLQSAMVTASENDIVRRTAVLLLPGVDADVSDKQGLLLPLLKSQIESETLAAVVTSLCSWNDDETILSEIVSIWPVADIDLRSAVLDCIEQPVSRASLAQTEVETIEVWRTFEPIPRLLHSLNRLIQEMSSDQFQGVEPAW